MCSNDIEELKGKKMDIENSICDLYKEANSILHSGLFANEQEVAVVRGIKKLCVELLREVV